MISWNDLPFVLVILIIKTTKTNQKKLTIFVFLFFFFIVNFIIRIQRFLFLDFPNIFPTNGIFPIFFAAQQIRDYRFSIRVETDIIDEIFRYSFFFFFPSFIPLPDDSSWNVTNSQRCCPFSWLPPFIFREKSIFRSSAFAAERSTRVISGLGEGRMDETSFFTGKLTLLESSGRRNTRLLRFDTCVHLVEGFFFFFFQECVLGNLVMRNDERKITEEKLTRTLPFYFIGE